MKKIIFHIKFCSLNIYSIIWGYYRVLYISTIKWTNNEWVVCDCKCHTSYAQFMYNVVILSPVWVPAGSNK